MKSWAKRVVSAVLSLLAKAALVRFRPKVAAITGSVGKTSTKDAIFTVLSQFYHTRKSEKSYNSEIGIPLTILGMPNAWSNPVLWVKNFLGALTLLFFKSEYPDWLVLEVGADRPGDVASLSWLKPHVAVVTRLPEVPAHVEFFSSRDALVLEKSGLVRAARPDGAIVLNADDPDVLAMGRSYSGRIITFGLGSRADIRGLAAEFVYDQAGRPAGMRYKIKSGEEVAVVHLPGALGEHHLYPVLAAMAVGESLKLNFGQMVEVLGRHVSPPGRMRIIPGLKGATVIDDSYNSSPAAAKEALTTLKNLKAGGRKVAVLGDMLELGRFAAAEHEKLGRYAAACADLLVAVGLRARSIAEGALEAGLVKDKIFQFDEALEAGQFVQNLISGGDVVLVKGSQGIRLEKVVEEVMAEPERRAELLVRQEPEWTKR
ncbi:MAG: UDP-N-acetylmuramoyl-tripeptide--D-alanyl-D-alanine ligase [Candidatus Taylorbacteria bacterium]|nr:UDP-N-acetylmuramoyl-tripeptide--D-alanyl-D-alanine ligase [Candidatus Taylorbacteria bacterium]